MKPTIVLYLLLAFPSSCVCVHAQIHADVAVSRDGTDLGTFRILLHHDKAPRTVANFIGLAMGTRNWIDPATGAVKSGVPYYDGLGFHRLIHDFMIQGGDPLGTGTGGPGYVFQDEFDPTLRHDGAYMVSMANSGVNSNGSQFFITFRSATNLDDKHSVFGTVIDDAIHPDSRALIDGFTSPTNFPTDVGDRPLTPIVIDSIVVSGPDLAGFDLNDPGLGLPGVETVWMRLEQRGEKSFLIWDRKSRHEYPVRHSGDLDSWNLVAQMLSMGDENLTEVEVSSLVQPGTTFLSMSTVNYSSVPSLPATFFDAGSTLDLETAKGTLAMVFDGVGGGTWSFEETGGTVTAGALEGPYAPINRTIPSLQSSELIIPETGSYARFLSQQEVVFIFDEPVGPDQLTAIQPLLSFHSATGGWYTGLFNSDAASPSPLLGTFTWTSGQNP